MNDSADHARAAPLRLHVVCHRFGTLPVLDGISLDVSRGEIVAIVGPSGCGKTTLLNVIAGSIAPTSGNMDRRGRVRTVYQQSGLLPWRTVAENISLGLQNHCADSEHEQQLNEMLRLVRLEAFRDYYPHQLSGGMRQRTEVARALAGTSEILLLDEPFSSLDYLTRLRMRGELVTLLQARPRTVVLVTHDVTEAAQLADRVIVLSERPARVRREIAIAQPRPRELTHPIVVGVVHEALAELGLEHKGGSDRADSPVPMI